MNKEASQASPLQDPKKTPWRTYMSEDLTRTVQNSTDSAVRSARFFQQSSSTYFRAILESLPQMRVQFKTYENACFQKLKDEFITAREHPVLAGGLTVVFGLLLMRGSRRFLFRHTLGLLQGEEAHVVRAGKNTKELNLSIDLMKKESKKLLERASLAENDMKRGRSALMIAGSQSQGLAKSIYRTEAEANELMDLLREIPGREALKLRAEVASMASHIRRQRIGLDKKLLRISELGIPV